MTMMISSLVMWLHVNLVANPWATPMCTNPSTPPFEIDAPLGSFDDVRDELEAGVNALQVAHGRRQRNLEAEHRAEAALARVRFHPREYALDPHAKQLRSEAVALLADQLHDSDPGRARDWAYYQLSRYGASPNVHEFAYELGADVELLYSRAQKDIDVAMMAVIRVNCDSRCAAFVDGEPISLSNGYAAVDVVPGAHDVWVFDASRPDQGQFEEFELAPGEQRCVLFTAVGQALPTTDDWWDATMFEHGLEWALSCKSNVPNCPAQTLEHVFGRWTEHTLALSRSRSLRTLLVRVALDFADLSVDATPAVPGGSIPEASGSAAAEQESVSTPRAAVEANGPDGSREGDDEVLDAIDMVARMSWFDAGNSAPRIAGQLPSIKALFKARSELVARGSATIDIVCHRSCWPTIMGVHVEQGEHAVAPGLYYVEIHPVVGDEPPVGRWLTLDEGARELVNFGPEPEPAPLLLASLDTGEPVFDQKQQLRRVALGTAGAISLSAGALWSVAIAAGMIPNYKLIDTAIVLSPLQRQRLALYMTGAFSIHAILATSLFASMPRSQRPGMPLVAAGGGMLAGGALFTGIGVAGGIAADNARSRIESGRGDPELLALRERSSINTLIIGASTAGALLVSGSVLLGVGHHRARQSAPLRTARAKTKARVSSLHLSPSWGRQFTGLRLGGKF